MSDIIEIPKGEYDGDVYPCWIPIKNSAGEKLKPLIRCKCGVVTGIGLHHVHPDGTVTNSFFHTASSGNDPRGCEWHVWIKLKDWDGSEFLPNEEKANDK